MLEGKVSRLCILGLFLVGCASAEVKEHVEEQAPLPAPDAIKTEAVSEEPVPKATEPEDRGKLALSRIAVASTLKDKEPVDAATVFPATVGKLHCFTHIVNANGPKQITHTWYYGETVVSRVNLKVIGKSWRTHSTKSIGPGQKGAWRVEVLGPGGEKLGEARFEIK